MDNYIETLIRKNYSKLGAYLAAYFLIGTLFLVAGVSLYNYFEGFVLIIQPIASVVVILWGVAVMMYLKFYRPGIAAAVTMDQVTLHPAELSRREVARRATKEREKQGEERIQLSRTRLMMATEYLILLPSYLLYMQESYAIQLVDVSKIRGLYINHLPGDEKPAAQKPGEEYLLIAVEGEKKPIRVRIYPKRRTAAACIEAIEKKYPALAKGK